jgi:hypothetical protein
MARIRIVIAVSVIAVASLSAGCGSSGTNSRASVGLVPGGASAAEVSVIRGWAGALRRGDVSAAARYFALPSIYANGVEVNGVPAGLVIRTERQAQAVNRGLPCGAVLMSATPHGKYVEAKFRLTNRLGQGAGCGSGAGQSAYTDFVIAHGHIVDWIRAPAPQVAPPEVPTVPSTTSGSGLQI